MKLFLLSFLFLTGCYSQTDYTGRVVSSSYTKFFGDIWLVSSPRSCIQIIKDGTADSRVSVCHSGEIPLPAEGSLIKLTHQTHTFWPSEQIIKIEELLPAPPVPVKPKPVTPF